MKKKSIKIVPSNYLFFGSIFLIMLFPCCGIWLLYNAFTGYIDSTTIFGHIVYFLMCFSCIVLMPILAFFTFRQWFEILNITSDGIEIHKIFKKAKKFTYKEYSKIYYGYMTVRGFNEWFIIISDRTLSRYEQTNLNKINTDSIIMIKYNKRRLEKLREILPVWMTAQLKNPPK